MKWTSLGFHTFTILTRLTCQEAKRIYHAFNRLMKSGECIIIPYTLKFYRDDVIDNRKPDGFNITYETTKAGVRKGISWTLRFSNYSRDFKEYTLEATINPKILSGIIDYITAATEDDIKDIANMFDKEVKEISKEFPLFNRFKLKRIDYCVNFHLGELGIPCSTEQMMKLIKRSNIPHNYKERIFFNETSRRMKSDDLSLYLKSNSTTIQCYDKYGQLQRKYPDSPSVYSAKNIIRFEVQCNYMKVYNMRNAFKKASEKYSYDEFKEFFSKETCELVIRNYFDRVIMRGDYYPLKHSRNLIANRGFRGNVAGRMIGALDLVNPSRGGGGVHRAKITFEKMKLDSRDFKRGLLELQIDMGINPVAIPGDWGIKYIPNLMNAYDKLNGIQSEINISPSYLRDYGIE